MSAGRVLVAAGLLGSSAMIVACIAQGADLRPDSIDLELDHASHVSQHEPFTSTPTNYGFSGLALAARWSIGKLSLTVAEGIVLDPCQQQPFPQCGGLAGGRELFQARLAYTLWSK